VRCLTATSDTRADALLLLAQQLVKERRDPDLGSLRVDEIHSAGLVSAPRLYAVHVDTYPMEADA
jgi:hypothetical protein